MRILTPAITSECATCRTAFARSWFRPSLSSAFCSWKCRRIGNEIEATGGRIDRLMARYLSTDSFYLRDLWLTAADAECARLKILTRWNEA